MLLSGTAVAVLTVVSFFLVLKGASEEPYLSFRPYDAYEQVGGAFVLITLWLELLGALLWCLIKHRLSRLYWILVAWCGVALYFLYTAPTGYTWDINQYVESKAHPPRGLGGQAE
jgi:hypothetical protein